jgi:hypothetical protein
MGSNSLDRLSQLVWIASVPMTFGRVVYRRDYGRHVEGPGLV